MPIGLRKPSPEPLEIPIYPVLAAGTGLWALAGIALVFARDWLSEHDASWWPWACATGVVIGVLACIVGRRHDRRMADHSNSSQLS